MNQIAIAGDALAEKRREAARKAVETRRARLAAGISPGTVVPFKAKPPAPSAVSAALAAFEAEAGSECPDWHKAALALKTALTSRRDGRATIIRPAAEARPTALPSPPWHDYPVKGENPFHIVNPTIVVTFADGEIVRAPAVSKRGKPVNIGRGLRIAIAFYQARMAWRAGKSAHLFYCDVPAITACHCEDTGEQYDGELCTLKTADSRKDRSR